MKGKGNYCSRTQFEMETTFSSFYKGIKLWRPGRNWKQVLKTQGLPPVWNKKCSRNLKNRHAKHELETIKYTFPVILWEGRITEEEKYTKPNRRNSNIWHCKLHSMVQVRIKYPCIKLSLYKEPPLSVQAIVSKLKHILRATHLTVPGTKAIKKQQRYWMI